VAGLLAIEDNAYNRELMTYLLEASGHDVIDTYLPVAIRSHEPMPPWRTAGGMGISLHLHCRHLAT
jgi:hypothetical protein